MKTLRFIVSGIFVFTISFVLGVAIIWELALVAVWVLQQ